MKCFSVPQWKSCRDYWCEFSCSSFTSMSGFAPQPACRDLLREVEEAQTHLKSQAPISDETSFFSFTACFWFYPCIHSWVCQDGAVNNEVTVVASVPCRVMHLLLVILHHNWEQREMLKKREICSAFSVWRCPKQQKPFDEFCAKRFSSKKDKRCRMWLFEEGHLEANGHKVIREEKHWHFIKIGQC